MNLHPFEQAISVVGTIVGGIMTLTLFFMFANWISRRTTSGPHRMALKGILDEKTRVRVHLTNGETFDSVRFIGFTDQTASKALLPYELSGMVVLEHPDGRRTLIRSKLIRMIEAPPR